MDEILIEEKKYISSKQAAKVTGYAKDYIGQLCREGRVPARLVGRGWYVLETAIHDHRFGEQKTEQEAKTEPAASVFTPTWEPPRYEASPTVVLPSVKSFDEDIQKDESIVSQHLQDSWKAWFDRVADTEPVALADLAVSEKQIEKEEKEPEGDEAKEDNSAVNVPLHTVYRLPPEELLPRHTATRFQYEEEQYAQGIPQEREGKVGMAIQVAGALLAMSMAILATLGSGYFDEYLVSNSQVGIIAGVGLYNR